MSKPPEVIKSERLSSTVIIREQSVEKWCSLLDQLDLDLPFSENFDNFTSKLNEYARESNDLNALNELTRCFGPDPIKHHVKKYLGKPDEYEKVLSKCHADLRKKILYGLSLEDFVNFQCSRILGTIELFPKPAHSTKLVHSNVTLVQNVSASSINVKFIPKSSILSEEEIIQEVVDDIRDQESESRCLRMVDASTGLVGFGLKVLKIWIAFSLLACMRSAELYQPHHCHIDLIYDIKHAELMRMYPVSNKPTKSPRNVFIEPTSIENSDNLELRKLALCSLYNDLAQIKTISYFGYKQLTKIYSDTQWFCHRVVGAWHFKPELFQNTPVSLFGLPLYAEFGPKEVIVSEKLIQNLFSQVENKIITSQNRMIRLQVERQYTQSKLTITSFSIFPEKSESNPSDSGSKRIKLDDSQKLLQLFLDTELESYQRYVSIQNLIILNFVIKAKIPDGSMQSYAQQVDGGSLMQDSFKGGFTEVSVATVEIKSCSLITPIKMAIQYLKHLNHSDGILNLKTSIIDKVIAELSLGRIKRETLIKPIKFGFHVLDQTLKSMLISGTPISIAANLTEMVIITFPKLTSSQWSEIYVKCAATVEVSTYPFIRILQLAKVKVEYNTIFSELSNAVLLLGSVTKSLQRLKDDYLKSLREDQAHGATFMNVISYYDLRSVVKRIIQRMAYQQNCKRISTTVAASLHRDTVRLMSVYKEKHSTLLEDLKKEIRRNLLLSGFKDYERMMRSAEVLFSSEYQTNAKILRILKGEIPFSNDFSTVLEVEESRRVMILKILDSSRYQTSTEKFVQMNPLQELRLNGSSSFATNSFQLTFTNCVKISMEQFLTELNCYLRIHEKCSENSTTVNSIPKLFQFGYFVNNSTIENRLFAEGPFLLCEKLDNYTGPLTEEGKSHAVTDAFSNLTKMHQKAQVIHGDIKENNLVICKNGTEAPMVKFFDFGLSLQAADYLDSLKNAVKSKHSTTEQVDLREKLMEARSLIEDGLLDDYTSLREVLIRKGLLEYHNQAYEDEELLKLVQKDLETFEELQDL
jgi:serine/threonine protein kinase